MVLFKIVVFLNLMCYLFHQFKLEYCFKRSTLYGQWQSTIGQYFVYFNLSIY